MQNSSEFQYIAIDQIHESTNNPRRTFDESKLQELAESIRTNGLIQPITVRPNAEGFEIVAGARRFRAAQIAEVFSLPARIVDIDDAQALVWTLLENAQRVDVHPYEEAQGFERLLDMPGYDVAALVEKTGKSASHIYARLALLQLIPAVAEAFAQERITASHANLLARLPQEVQAQAFEQCWRKDWQDKEPHLLRGNVHTVNPDAETVTPCEAAKRAIIVYGKRVGTTLTVCTDNNCPVHDPRAAARRAEHPKPVMPHAPPRETEEEAEARRQQHEQQRKDYEASRSAGPRSFANSRNDKNRSMRRNKPADKSRARPAPDLQAHPCRSVARSATRHCQSCPLHLRRQSITRYCRRERTPQCRRCVPGHHRRHRRRQANLSSPKPRPSSSNRNRRRYLRPRTAGRSPSRFSLHPLSSSRGASIPVSCRNPF